MCVIATLSLTDCKTGKSAIAKKRSMLQKKEGAQKHCRVPIQKFKQKKDVKLPHHRQRVFSDCHA
jgi:hypothetical protein